MNRRFYYLMGILFLLATGCTKDFDIDPGEAAPQYVIEGKISNMRGPHYVRVTKAANRLGTDMPPLSGVDNAEAITGALVIIRDDMGMTDTLRPVPQSNRRYNPLYMGDRGYYGTTRLTGIPGHTYYLQVHIGSKVFQASAYMPATAPVIDSVVLKKDPVADPSGQRGDAAFAYFKEPRDELNYYLLQHNIIADSAFEAARVYFSYTSVFPLYVFDDKTLSPYVEGMQLRTIFADNFGNNRMEPYWFTPGDSLQVRLSSLTRNTYDYLKALEKQFLDDGNVYRPTPASPTGNISGGALGLFWAANVSHKVYRP
ncbi:DUF4249 domain-containing protein [Pseudoflavitalea sp. X16]|uniref:DUF4249 domain-containing protein n=1 Tax=Paraflavitalea devenefica TaxID=2716334 RepID=UPI001423B58B|nr:DUF4249 domain-containing protein [Paraflavitalea devenefica]NII26083.1 DUF4249 domain-containing protein [Paraflavitalea devenefica]